MLPPAQVWLIIAVTFVGFLALAAALLVPVYLFMRREEDRGEQWNEELRKQGRLRRTPESAASVERDQGA